MHRVAYTIYSGLMISRIDGGGAVLTTTAVHGSGGHHEDVAGALRASSAGAEERGTSEARSSRGPTATR